MKSPADGNEILHFDVLYTAVTAASLYATVRLADIPQTGVVCDSGVDRNDGSTMLTNVSYKLEF